MKNITKFLGFIVIVMIAGFSMIACDDGTTPNGKSDPALSGTVSISGTAVVGQTLTANTNSLGGSGTITYQWKRGIADIGTNSSTYTVQTADVGSTITVTVTRSGNSGIVSSNPIGPITDLPPLTGEVSISGNALVGETLTANTNSLGGSGAISYQWKRGISNIGTNSNTYVVQSADVGSTITVTVTRSGYSGSKTSEATDVVALSGLTGDDAVDFGVSASIDNTFNVGTTTEWNNALSAITSGGNGKNYIINIIGDFFITGRTTSNFGNVSAVKVSIRGEGRTLTLSSGGNIVRVGSEQTVILRDVTLRGLGSNSNSIVYVLGGGTFTMQSGKISGNTASSVSGVYVAVAATFNMNGGEISGNTSSGSTGGVVSVYQYGTFTMNGGKISGNTSSGANGGVVMVSEGTFAMQDGEISDNTGRGIYVGNNGIFRIANGIIYGSNEAETSLRNTSVLANSGTAQYGTGSGNAWNGNGTINTTEYTVKVVNGVPHIGNEPANNYTFNTAATDDWNNALSAIVTYDNFSYTINVTADFDLAGRTTASFGSVSGITVTLRGTGRTLGLSSNGNLVRTGDNQTVILGDLTLKGRGLNNTSLVYIGGGTFSMEGGEISGNRNTSSYGGGVYLSGGIFTMSDGKISGNYSSDTNSYGGGVYMSGGIFTMNDGEISGNISGSYGGGVYVGSGTFVMNDGKISGNTTTPSNSSSNGCGVYVSTNGTFTMNDGEISGNRSVTYTTYAQYGGGVWVNGTFRMNGGKISGNSAGETSSSCGHGVYVSINGTFTMSDGEISGNTAQYDSTGDGGGVRVGGGTFRIANGIIYGSNEADTSLRNTAASGAALSRISEFSGTVQYGTFSGEEWISNGTIHTTEHTIKVVNGVPYIGDELTDNYIFNTASTTEWNNALNAITTYNNFSYTINVTADFDVAGRTTNSFDSVSGITVTLQGTGRTITLSSNGNILRTANYQNIILRDLTLRGRASNDTSVVYVDGGTFTMQSGEISGNTTTGYGGGVYVSSGTFTKTGGTITGYASDTVNGNVVKNSSGVVQNNRGHAVYVSDSKRRENTAGPGVNLDSSVAGSAGGWEN